MGLGGMKDRKVHAAESQSAASRPVTFRIETTYWGPETRRRLVHWREQRERLGVRWTSRKRSGSIGDLATHRSAGGIYLNWGGYNMSTRYHDPGQETWNLPPHKATRPRKGIKTRTVLQGLEQPQIAERIKSTGKTGGISQEYV